MKKIIITTLVLLFPLTLSAFPYKDKIDAKSDFSVYAGINVADPSPVFGLKIGVEYAYFRASLDISRTYMHHYLSDEFITTVNPAIGLVYGDKYKAYLMIGVQNYGYINDLKNSNYFRSDHIYGVVKAGYQHLINHIFFINFEINHLFHDKKSMVTHFPNTNLCFGFGFRF